MRFDANYARYAWWASALAIVPLFSCSSGTSSESSGAGGSATAGSGGAGGMETGAGGAGGSNGPAGGAGGSSETGGGTGTGGAGGAAGSGGAVGPGLEGDWAELQTLLSGTKGVATSPITGIGTNIKYTPGMLLGNADLGVIVGGDTTSAQKFYFAKSDFWGTGGTMAGGATGVSILSLGSLTLNSSTPSTDPGPVYRMEQDILNAEVRTTLRLGKTLVNLRSYTADGDNVLVTEISSAAGADPVTITADLAMPNDATYPFTTGVSNGVLWATRANNTSDYVARAAIAVKVLGASFGATASPAAHASGDFTLNGGATVTLVAMVRSDARIGTAGPNVASLRDDAAAKVAALAAADVDKMSGDHRAFWKDFWLKSYLRVNDPTLENYYYGALYVLGCSTRASTRLPPSLWGSWVPNDLMRWGGRYFLNYNEQAAYYGVFSGNRPDVVLPYNDVIYYELPWQRNITHNAGYQGLTFTRTVNPYNHFRQQPSPASVAGAKDWKKLPADQKSNGVFAGLPLIWYWEYTQDADYLKTKLYPFVKELDAFWRDYMVSDGTRYVIEHSSAHEGSDDRNPNLDIGFFRKVEHILLAASVELGVDADLRPVWQDVLDKLSKYPVATYNGKTVYANSESTGFSPGDQPINMEGGVFPGENIYLGGDAGEIKLAIDTLSVMGAWGVTGGGNSGNGFPKEFPIAARVGWPAADLIDKFKAAILYTDWRSTNLTHAQEGGGIETSGAIETIHSMLMQSEGGVVRVFPVWPADKDAHFKRLRAKGAFLVSSEWKSGQVTAIEVVSEKGKPLTLKNPWSTGTPRAIEVDASGNTLGPAPCTVSGGNIACTTSPGGRYTITSGP